jgi:mannitol-1-phosphate/altronate dehydrogenase
VARFSNQAIADQLERVCSDGSSKFPKFTVPTINRLIADGRRPACRAGGGGVGVVSEGRR